MSENTKTGKSEAPVNSASETPPESLAGDPSISGPFKSLDSIKRKKEKRKGGKKRKLGLSVSRPDKKAWIRTYPDAEEFSFFATMLTVEREMDSEFFFIDPSHLNSPEPLLKTMGSKVLIKSLSIIRDPSTLSA